MANKILDNLSTNRTPWEELTFSIQSGEFTQEELYAALTAIKDTQYAEALLQVHFYPVFLSTLSTEKLVGFILRNKQDEPAVLELKRRENAFSVLTRMFMEFCNPPPTASE